METHFKVTYASLTADNEPLQAALDAAFTEVRARSAETHPYFVDGEAITQGAGPVLRSTNPADPSQVVGQVAGSDVEEVQRAVAAARKAYPRWRQTPWEERVRLVRRAATLIRDRVHELSAWLVLENGKNRVEALGEIEETADLYDYYALQLENNQGYVRPMERLSESDDNTSVLRPYGVWAVVAPFNFPYALLGAPMAAALLAGNTVVGKPASDTPISGSLIAGIFHDAGFPAGTVNLVTGGGSTVGAALLEHEGIDGVTFTGSYEIGFENLYRNFSKRYPKPCIAEMGGKNPAIISQHADLDKAASGVFRSAFGMGGQKCSACSRVYVERPVLDAFLDKLKTLAQQTAIGDPSERNTFLGPVGQAAAVKLFESSLKGVDNHLVHGGKVIDRPGYYVEPTILRELPAGHALLEQELFLPVVCVQAVDSIEEGFQQANATPLGLTAGFFSAREDEIDAFLDQIEAGVVYINRAAGATTGAWPGVQPFGGWKGSGSTGKNIGGLYSLLAYMREQSRTLTRS